MTVFVSITPKKGEFSRYKAEKRHRLWRTHAGTAGPSVSFTEAAVNEIRYSPNERFRISAEEWRDGGTAA